MTQTNTTVALIIGGSSGMGKATAERLLKRGVGVHLVARDTERLSPLRVLLVTLHEVPGDGRLAGDKDLEAVAGLRIVDYIEDLLDVGLGLFEPSRHD
ncbi:MAG: SDR family NAD(P)-dependent oxidoreductase [Myxococcales bacterium]|nr:SDR family NAD(P)-dependent oxidoreductase [Myxococcales bacterium]